MLSAVQKSSVQKKLGTSTRCNPVKLLLIFLMCLPFRRASF